MNNVKTFVLRDNPVRDVSGSVGGSIVYAKHINLRFQAQEQFGKAREIACFIVGRHNNDCSHNNPYRLRNKWGQRSKLKPRRHDTPSLGRAVLPLAS